MLEIVLIFLLGLCVGSFLNVLVDRLPKGQSAIKGRSRCDKCKKTLKWYDLIPLLSFIFLKGKCRYCRANISFYYSAVELITGIMFALAYIFAGFNIYNLGFIIFLFSSLIVIFFADLKYGIIPDKIVFPTTIITFFYLFINHSSLIVNHLLSAVGACLFFFLLFLITKGKGMGFGDVKFSFLMGLVLGFPNIIAGLYVAFLTGAIVGCILILWMKKRAFGTVIPFGPFLVIGALIASFFGENLIQTILAVSL